MLLLPVAIGRTLEGKNPPQFRRGFNVALAAVAGGAVVVLVVFALARPASWYEEDWPQGPALAVKRSVEPGTRVFAADVYADWLLWKIPELRGRLAYDVRFEIYSSDWFQRLLRYNAESGSDWKTLADGYPIVVVDETERSHTADFLAEPGAHRIFHTKNVTVIARPHPS